MSDAAVDAMAIAVPFVAAEEGTSLTVYQDTAGVWTIGTGTTVIAGQKVTASTPPCTAAQAAAWLAADMAAAAAAVTHGVTLPTATQHQRAAFTSFAYNEGINGFLGSTLLKLFNTGDLAGCEAQFGQWVYDHDPATGQLVAVQGLVNRRNAELALFKTADSAAVASAAAPAVKPVFLYLGCPPTPAVTVLQTALQALGLYQGALDEDFGPMTFAALRNFQAGRCLLCDGEAETGGETFAALGINPTA